MTVGSILLSGVVIPPQIMQPVVFPTPHAFAYYALAMPFKTEAQDGYWVSSIKYPALSSVPGYTYTRSGDKGEINALTGADRVDDFAANVPGIPSGVGYWSRSAVTNSQLRSQEFDHAYYFKGGSSVTANTANDPVGTATAETWTRSAISEQHYIQDGNALSFVAGSVYTHSIFAKQGTGRYLQVCFGSSGGVFPATAYVNFDLQAGTFSAAAGATGYIVDCGNGWFRCVVVATCAVSGVSANYISAVDSLSAGQIAAGAGNSSSIYIWQWQLMTGRHQDGGPLITTVAATLTVGEDNLRVTPTTLTNQDMLIWINLTRHAVDNDTGVTIDDGTGTNEIVVRDFAGSGIIATVVSGGSIVYDQSVATQSGATTWLLRRLSGAWQVGKVTAGVLTWGTSAAAAFPAGLNRLTVGNRPTGTVAADSPIHGLFIKNGTFSTDAAVLAAVTATL